MVKDLVSDTFKIAVPDKLPEIVLSSGTTTTRSKSNVKTFEIKENVIEKNYWNKIKLSKLREWQVLSGKSQG